MGKTIKWLRSFFLTSKKFTSNHNSSPTGLPSVPPTTPKDKKRWSFRRSHSAAKGLNSTEAPRVVVQAISGSDNEQITKHVMVMAEDAAATKIQASFRSHLARKALCALRGLVKLQALVRGHLVRKRATATLRCMEAAQTQRPSSAHRRSTHDRLTLSYNDMERGLEENIKIVEMDYGEPKGGPKHRNSCSNRPPPARYGKDDYQISPSPSALTDMSPTGCTTHFKDYGFNTAQNSPHYAQPLPYDHSLFPNYMANTESSRAKARSQSAPRQRTAEPFERPPIRRRASMEGRNVPRAVRMQRSSSHVGATETTHNYQYPWSMKLDRLTVSMVESECGSNSTVLTNNYCRSVTGYM